MEVEASDGAVEAKAAPEGKVADETPSEKPEEKKEDAPGDANEADVVRLDRFLADSASMQGRRPKQQHRHVKVPDLTKAAKALKMPIDHLDQPCAFFGVYDGHEGQLCAEFAAKGFHGKLLKKLSADSSKEAWTDDRFRQVMREICEELDSEFLARYRTAPDGCTLTVALVMGARVCTAWVGDARCYLARCTQSGEMLVVPLTEDHRPMLPGEAERIQKAGGVIVDFGGGFAGVAHEGYEERVREMRRAQALGLGSSFKEPVALGVSRALGDREFKAAGGKALLVPTPDVRFECLDPSHKFLVLTCGGIPGVMTDQEVVADLDAIREADPQADVRAGCGAVVAEAYQRGSEHNLTVVMARLLWTGPPDAGYERRPPGALARLKAGAAASTNGGSVDQAMPTETATAASKRRRLEAAAAVSKQKVAAYERSFTVGDVAARKAEEARKQAELEQMRTELEVAAKAAEEAQAEAAKKAQAAAEAAAVEEPVGLDAAELFFAARKASKQAAPKAKLAEGGGEPKGLDAAEAFFAARRAAKEAKPVATEQPGLDAAEAFFAARRSKQAAEKPPAEVGAQKEAVGLDAAEAFFAARRSKQAADKDEVQTAVGAPGPAAKTEAAPPAASPAPVASTGGAAESADAAVADAAPAKVAEEAKAGEAAAEGAAEGGDDLVFL